VRCKRIEMCVPVAVRKDDIHNPSKRKDNIIPHFDFSHRRCAPRASNFFLVFLGNKSKSDFIECCYSRCVVHAVLCCILYRDSYTTRASNIVSSIRIRIYTDIPIRIFRSHVRHRVVQVNQYCG